jgi:hypothetical protein
MRTIFIAALLPAVLLAACASDNRSVASATELDRLRADCEARGGMLRPTGRITGTPALDNPCVIRGGGSNLPPAR